VVYSGGPYSDNQNGQVIDVPLCLESGCYIFEIEDSYGDGICCSNGNGSYTILDPEGDVILTGGDFEDNDVTQFCTRAMDIGNHALLNFNISPNPSAGSIQLSGLPAGATCCAMDMMGRTILVPTSLNNNGSSSVRLNTETWPRGWVVIQISFDGRTCAKRVLLR
jgi:hypothetical protein